MQGPTLGREGGTRVGDLLIRFDAQFSVEVLHLESAV